MSLASPLYPAAGTPPAPQLLQHTHLHLAQAPGCTTKGLQQEGTRWGVGLGAYIVHALQSDMGGNMAVHATTACRCAACCSAVLATQPPGCHAVGAPGGVRGWGPRWVMCLPITLSLSLPIILQQPLPVLLPPTLLSLFPPVHYPMHPKIMCRARDSHFSVSEHGCDSSRSGMRVPSAV